MSRSEQKQTTFACDRPGCDKTVDFDHDRISPPIDWTNLRHETYDLHSLQISLCSDCSQSFKEWYFYISNAKAAREKRNGIPDDGNKREK